MKKIIIFLFCLFFFIRSIGQPVTQRSSPTITVADPNLFGLRSFKVPAYSDTSSANLTYSTLDSSGKIVYTFDCNCLWFRQNNPKKWVHINSTNGNNGGDTLFAQRPLFFDSLTRSPNTIIKFITQNGVIGGGVSLDSCRRINISSGIVTINYTTHTFVFTTLTIAASDPTNPRTDLVVVDTSGNVSIIQGTPATPALDPTYNPSSQFVLARYTIGANATCLDVRQDIIYDGIADNSGQWNTSTSGTITTNFISTTTPIHLVQELFVSTYTNGSSITFTKPSGNDTALAGSVIKIPIFFNGIMNNQIQVQFFLNGVAVSNNLVINPYFNANDSNQYQIPVIPLSAWSFPGGSIFNKVVFTFAGNDISGAKGIHFDYIQLQFGNNNVSNVLTLTTNGSSGASTLIDNVLNIPVYGGGNNTITWSVLDSLSTPNPSAAIGDLYLVGTSPTGLFVGHANNIATYDAIGHYKFDTVTVVGTLLYNAATKFVSQWTGTAWVRVGQNIPIGAGVTNYVARWITPNILGIGVGYDDGTNFGIGTQSPGAKLTVRGNAAISPTASALQLIDISGVAGSRDWQIGNGSYAYGDLVFSSNTVHAGVIATPRVTFSGNGNVVLNTAPPSGASTDSILTRNASTGVINMRDAASFGSTVFANNGLTKVVDSIQLGGTLNQVTIIDQAGNTFHIINGTDLLFNSQGGGGYMGLTNFADAIFGWDDDVHAGYFKVTPDSVFINGLNTISSIVTVQGNLKLRNVSSGASTDSILTRNASTGVVNMRDAANFIQSFQQTLDVSSILNKFNIIDINGNPFMISEVGGSGTQMYIDPSGGGVFYATTANANTFLVQGANAGNNIEMIHNNGGTVVIDTTGIQINNVVDNGTLPILIGVNRGNGFVNPVIVGSFATAYTAKTTTYPITTADYTIEATSGTFTTTLPTAVGITGRIYTITNSGSGILTVATTSSQTFVNVTATPTTLTLTQFHTVIVQANGANWLRLTSL